MFLFAVPFAGIASFAAAIFVAFKLHDTFKDRWTEGRINAVSVFVCFLFLGSPAYAMAGLNYFSFTLAATVHLGMGCLYAVIIVSRFMGYIEASALVTILGTVVLLLVPVIQGFCDARVPADTSVSLITQRAPTHYGTIHVWYDS